MYLVFKYICKKYLVFKYILSMYLVFKYKKKYLVPSSDIDACVKSVHHTSVWKSQ